MPSERHLFLALGLSPRSRKFNALCLWHRKVLTVQHVSEERFLRTKVSRVCWDIGTLGEEGGGCSYNVKISIRFPIARYGCFANLRTFPPSLLPSLPPSSGRRQGFCVMCSMEEHVHTVLHSSGTAIEPWAIIRVLRRKPFQVLLQVFLPFL